MPEPQTGGRFVVQRHQSRSPHYDFRLEKDGVFKSWAGPKGLPDEPGVERLALATDDHDLAFGEFAGAIPAGQPGAGVIERWDEGTYALHEWTDARIAFTLFGNRYLGEFQLIRFERGGGRAWLRARVARNRTHHARSPFPRSAGPLPGDCIGRSSWVK
jgi:DNA ligase D-like protein (predicted 3'-phosphoesterase)